MFLWNIVVLPSPATCFVAVWFSYSTSMVLQFVFKIFVENTEHAEFWSGIKWDYIDPTRRSYPMFTMSTLTKRSLVNGPNCRSAPTNASRHMCFTHWHAAQSSALSRPTISPLTLQLSRTHQGHLETNFTISSYSQHQHKHTQNHIHSFGCVRFGVP